VDFSDFLCGKPLSYLNISFGFLVVLPPNGAFWECRAFWGHGVGTKYNSFAGELGRLLAT
jgi:hypothetical protein